MSVNAYREMFRKAIDELTLRDREKQRKLEALKIYIKGELMTATNSKTLTEKTK